MRRVLPVLFAALLLALPCAAAAGDSLVGVWEGTAYMYMENRGEISTPVYVEIISHNGPVFHGVKKWTSRSTGKTNTENFSGTVSRDGKALYIAEHDDGVSIGRLYGDTLDIHYMESGGRAVSMVMQLKRTK